MGKGSKRQRKDTRTPQKHQFREEVIDDEIDAFHKQRDVIPLDVNGDAGDSDSDSEQPVFDFVGVDDDESDASDAVNDDDIRGDKELAKMLRQAKYLRQQNVGGDDPMSDDDEQEEERKDSWGRKKSLYYDGDNADYEVQSSDEDLPLEEEAEVMKIQREKAKFLSMEDFGLEDAYQEDNDSKGHEKTFQEILAGKRSATKSSVDGVFEGSPFESYEVIKKDLNAFSKEEQMDVVYSSAPELLGLLSELNQVLDELQKVKPLKVRERKDIIKGGLHYSEVKHILLLTYCQAISFYLLLKSEGHPVREHPVIARLVEIKSLFDKMKQIDANLPSEIEELLNHDPTTDSQTKLVRETIPLEPKPDTKKVKVPAKLSNEGVKNHDITTEIKVASKKHKDIQVGLQSKEMLKVRASLEARLKQKGIYSSTYAKPERTQNHVPTPVNGCLESLHDYDDDVHHTGSHHGLSNVPTSSLHPSKLSQLNAIKANKPKFVSGDDDLPKRDDIGERRRKYELRVLARAGAGSIDDDGVGDEDRLGTKSMDVDVNDAENLDSEDDFYREVKRRKAEKLEAKEKLYSRTPAVSQISGVEADGKRLITQQMEKNRGLTRSRNKRVKIPRKKYKVKHQKSVIRRKGQVRDIRKPSGPYGGESTGININVSRSIRFKS